MLPLGDDDALGAPFRYDEPAVTAWDLFLMLTTNSVSRPIPPKRSWRLPWISVGRPARSARIRSAIRSSSGARCTAWLR